MKTKLLYEADGKRTFAVVLQTDDEAMRCLKEFAQRERIGGAQVTVIGALRRAKLAYFDWETKAYQPIEVGEQVEVASLVGDIAIGPDGRPASTRMRCSAVGTAVPWQAISRRRTCARHWRSSSPNLRPSVQGEGQGERLGPHPALKRLLAAAAAVLLARVALGGLMLLHAGLLLGLLRVHRFCQDSGQSPRSRCGLKPVFQYHAVEARPNWLGFHWLGEEGRGQS